MKNTFFITAGLFLITSVFSNAWAGGVGVGNGGDSVFCSPSSDDNLNGYYSLDYLMTLNGAGISNAVDVNTSDESLTRIKTLLETKYPALAVSFENFLKESRNVSDWTQPRIWLASAHGLLDINDEQIKRALPAHCGQSSTTEKVSVIQTVVRIEKPSIIQYEFDAKIIAELAKRPLQYSFLLVHEWLWDHTDDPQIIRWANQFLHSSHAAELTAEDFQKSLNAIGISAGYSGFFPVCRRSLEVSQYIEQITGKGCQFVTEEDLSAITHIQLSQLTAETLNINDLNGMALLNAFTIANSAVKSLPKEFFAKNPLLTIVTFQNTKMATFDLDVFRDNRLLNNIAFQDVPLQTLSSDFAFHIPDHLAIVYFVNTQLTGFPEGFFENLMTSKKPVKLSMQENKLLDSAAASSMAAKAGFKNLGLY